MKKSNTETTTVRQWGKKMSDAGVQGMIQYSQRNRVVPDKRKVQAKRACRGNISF